MGECIMKTDDSKNIAQVGKKEYIDENSNPVLD